MPAFRGWRLVLASLLLTSFLPAADSASAQARRSATSTTAKAFSADRFARAMRTNREDVQSAALDDAARLHSDHADLPAALWRFIEPACDGKTKVTPVLLSAVSLYCGLRDEKQTAHQVSLVQATEVSIALAAAERLAASEAPEAFDPIVALRRRPEYARHYGFRRAVLGAISRYSQPTAVDWLIETLAESDGQLKYEAARQLPRTTGRNLGGKADAWRTWWSSHRAEFAQTGKEAPTALPAAEMPWDEAVPKIFGVPIYAKRVVFVIDRSTRTESSGASVTRLDDAQRTLERTIRGLPDGTLFGLVAYEATCTLWHNQLVAATVESRSESLRFVYSLFPGNKSACYEALDSALALDPNLELIVFLSNGEPTAGQIVDRNRIVRVITARNAATRVRIDVVGFDPQGPDERFLDKLASSNFGTYRVLR